ncbi:hypothetical protein HanPI659440_Chr01g0000871 [Helianthus annuus]|nr:hypothetical protein HanPI659440_Chr14g0559751 [Helianthus annuus]KAJ0808203.1 hypothetical protein HanPI659440_Chr01g0000871 [Helianthus annuus]
MLFYVLGRSGCTNRGRNGENKQKTESRSAEGRPRRRYQRRRRWWVLADALCC